MKLKNRKGFSFLEMIISMVIAVLIMITVVAAFASFIKTRNVIITQQQDMEDARNALDLMAKDLRMSAYQVTPDTATIKFYSNSTNMCVSYWYDSANKAIKSDMEAPTPSGSPDPSTCKTSVTYTYNNNITNLSHISSLIFNLTPSSATRRGVVTIVLVVDGQTIETTVSLRDYREPN